MPHDFLDDVYDDDGFEEQPYDEYLTVAAFLEMHFGKQTGKEVYKALLRRAQQSAAEVGGCPGLIFNDEGGEFVSFSDELDEHNFGLYTGDDME